jgi:predicted enzyme related to lactoylglutathione lyase
MFLGLRTINYAAPDLDAAKAWFTALLGHGPYFDEPFYVGFEVGGYELGLNPDLDPAESPRTYWGVADAQVALDAMVAAGATVHDPVTEVGDGIRLGTVREPGGSLLGVIENPHFVAKAVDSPGPGA